MTSKATSISSDPELSDSFKSSIVDVILEKLGQSTNASHVVLYTMSNRTNSYYSASPVHCWQQNAEFSLEPRSLSFGHIHFSNDLNQLRNNQPILIHTSSLGPSEQEMLNIVNVDSRLILPLLIDKELWGIISLDNTDSSHSWSIEDLIPMTFYSNLLASVINERKAQVAEIQALHAAARKKIHQMKNHLQGIAGLLELKITGNDSEDNNLLNAITQIKSISAAYSRPPKSAEYSGNLEHILKQIVQNIQYTWKAVIHLDLEMDSPSDVPDNEIVPLSLVITELLINAAKHRLATNDQIIFKAVLQNNNTRMRISNPSGPFPQKTDNLLTQSNTPGIKLIRSLLPAKGINLIIKHEQGFTHADLQLLPVYFHGDKLK